MTRPLPQEGSLAEHPLPELLLACYRQRVTAALHVAREGVEKRIWLDHGVPVMAESNLPSESLGIQLLDAGRITRADYARVVELVSKKKCKEGAALLALERVAPRELFDALKQQVKRRILDCLGWPQGRFSVTPGESPAADAGAFRCDPVPLVQEAVAIHWSPAALREALGMRLARYAVANARTEPVAHRLHRDPAVDRLVAGIGGGEHLAALLADAPVTALAAAYVLDGVGAVEWADRPAEAAPGEGDAGDAALDIEVVVTQASPGAPATAGSDAGAAPAAAPRAATRDLAPLREEITALHAALDERNHYELLGVARDADAGAIRRAYVAAAKRFHPDAVARAGLAELRAAAEALFARIAEANEVLSDPARRRDYDVVLDGGAEDLDTARLVQAESLYRKAEILVRAGNFAGALEFLRPCVALWPDDGAYQAALGWCFYKKSPSEPKPAREALERAIALEPQDAVAHFRLGMVLRALGDEEGAEAMLGRAKRLDPKVRS